LRNGVMYWLRWVLFMPGALIGSYASYFLMGLVAKLGFDGEITSIFDRAYYEALTGCALGAGFVFVGATIAPSHSKKVAFFLGGLGLITAGTLVVFDAMKQCYWCIWNGIFVVVGIVLVVIEINRHSVQHLWQKITSKS